MTKRLRDKHYTAKLRIQNQELKAQLIPMPKVILATDRLHHYEIKHQISPEFSNMFHEKYMDEYARESVVEKMHDLLMRNVVKDEYVPGRYSLDIWVKD